MGRRLIVSCLIVLWIQASCGEPAKRIPVAPVSAYVVSVAPDASADENYAAQMVAAELGQRTCGHALPVVAPSVSARPTIAVGYGAVSALGRALLPSNSTELLGDEGYVLVGGGVHQWLGMSGREGSPRGTSYSAVEFLEAVGIGFLAWDCTIYPACPGSFPALNLTRLPRQFSYRSIFLWPFPGHIEPGNHFTVVSHSHPALIDGGQGSALPPWSQFSETHPDWFWPRPVRGQPAPAFWQVCWTNASMVEYVLSWCEQQLTKDPSIQFLQISPNDGGDTCQSPSELRANVEEGTKSGSLFRAINAIATAIAPRWPGTKIVTLAYAWTQRPPQPSSRSKIPAMHPNVIIYFAPIDDNFAIPHFVDGASQVHQFCGSDPNCIRAGEYNRVTTADISRWQQLVTTGNLWVWDYVTNFNGVDGYMIPFPNIPVLSQNIKGFAKAGATNYYPEGETESNGGEMSELKTYIITKLLWDPSLDENVLIAEFLEGYYGAAAGAMQDYLDAFADAAAPSSSEIRFDKGECVQVAARPWASGGRAEVTSAHPDGTYEVNMTHPADLEPPSHPDVISWVYLEPCDGHRPFENTEANKSLLVDMMAESCGVMQNGSHSGWACGYLNAAAALQGLRALVAAAATPGLTSQQHARILRSSLPMHYVALVKWEELQGWVSMHPEQGAWPLNVTKEVAFVNLVASLKAMGITTLGEDQEWTEEWLRDRIFFGNQSSLVMPASRRRSLSSMLKLARRHAHRLNSHRLY